MPHRPPKPCIFCQIVAGTEPKSIVYQDDQFVAFNDRSPGASLHLLIIPKSHIGTVRNLSPSSHTLLSDLHVLATRLLIENGYTAPDQRRIGFHVPPFNSVNHLHCHVLGLPFKNWIRKVKYEPAGWAIWFVDLELLIRALRAADMREEKGTWRRRWNRRKYLGKGDYGLRLLADENV